ncbi:DNA-binding protein [Hahella sp. KA22]|uniref:DNA-binding protein n=1 Tax=Hahella sp. KA22 TaxID=1628392 RepID=UPI000FDE8761|nr:DNA-binding protein [Hahella sp. KA22]AZZ94706.1 DNA-binding protein [Hahella sp. KA22]QAY58079.1 DNA-binding protein [Hahella sp. KA22]
MEKNLTITSPVMTKKAFAECSGLREDQVRGQIERGYIPVKYIGRLVLVNVALLMLECMEEDGKRR